MRQHIMAARGGKLLLLRMAGNEGWGQRRGQAPTIPFEATPPMAARSFAWPSSLKGSTTTQSAPQARDQSFDTWAFEGHLSKPYQPPLLNSHRCLLSAYSVPCLVLGSVAIVMKRIIMNDNILTIDWRDKYQDA